jgi:hypothetical protein
LPRKVYGRLRQVNGRPDDGPVTLSVGDATIPVRGPRREARRPNQDERTMASRH